jgi:hypothetical protein
MNPFQKQLDRALAVGAFGAICGLKSGVIELLVFARYRPHRHGTPGG